PASLSVDDLQIRIHAGLRVPVVPPKRPISSVKIPADRSDVAQTRGQISVQRGRDIRAPRSIGWSEVNDRRINPVSNQSVGSHHLQNDISACRREMHQVRMVERMIAYQVSETLHLWQDLR